MITFIVLALTISGRALCSSEPMRMHEELLINSTILGQFFETVEITTEENTLAGPVNVSGYVVNVTPNWEDTGFIDQYSIEKEYVVQQKYVAHSFRLVNRSRVFVTVRTTRIEGSGVGNLSAAFFFLDEENYELYQSGSNYTTIECAQEDVVEPSLRSMPSFFSSTLVANASSALYYALLENNDYIDMTADWNFTVERTKFNISSVPISSSCSYIVNKTDPNQKISDDDDEQKNSCSLNVTYLKDYYIVISTIDVNPEPTNNYQSGRVIISSRGLFMGGWRFGSFGVLSVLSAMLFFLTCFIALCYKRPTGVPVRKEAVGDSENDDDEDDDDDDAFLPVLQGAAPELRILQPSPPPL